MIQDGRVLVLDLDGTLCPTKPAGMSYADLVPDAAMVARLCEYRREGWYVVLQTSRNMRTHEGNVGRINATTLPELIDWARRHEIPFDEIHVGKPWAGHGGFYVDDRTIRPAEFLALDAAEIADVLRRDALSDA